MTLKKVEDSVGSLSVPAWPESRGLSASDLRRRSDSTAYTLSGVEAGANGLLGRWRVGKGVALFVQNDPETLDADRRTYLRFTRWRAVRTVANLLANMGAALPMNARFFTAGPRADAPFDVRVRKMDDQVTLPPGMYHPDYRTDWKLGDDPFRYFRW